MKLKVAVLIFIAAINSLLFHNCSPAHQNDDTGVASLDCLKKSLQLTYEAGYWKYLRSKSCNSCHSSNGLAGLPHFADEDINKAVLAFIPLGPSKIKAKLSLGHQGYEYSGMKSALDALASDWTTSKSNTSCENAQISSARSVSFFEGDGKTQGVVKTSMRSLQTMQWDLSARAPGVSVSVDIVVDMNASAMPLGYLIGNVKVKSTMGNVRIKNISVLLNNKDYFITTFNYLDVVTAKSDSFQLIPSTDVAAFYEKAAGEIYSNSDSWTLKIELVSLQ